MVQAVRRRLASAERDAGFTLVELIVVVIMIGVLLGIAIPLYLSFKDRAAKDAARAQIRIALPSTEAYSQDHLGSYAGMTAASLKAIDPATDPALTVTNVSASDFCLTDVLRDYTAWFVRSQGEIEVAKTGTGVPCS